MKFFWLLLAICVTVGTAAAWSVNHSRYASRGSQLDKIVYGEDVDASNVMDVVKSGFMASGAKAVMLTPEEHDFGLMALGDKGSCTFVVKNEGTDPLKLKVGSATCKCTIGSLATDTVPPGGQTDIKIEWTVKTNEKTFSQRAQIITNDPNKVVLDLRIRGVVTRELEIFPNKISFGDVAAGDSFNWEKNIYCYMDEEIVPIETKFASEQLTGLSDIELEPFEVSADDKNFSSAKQAFRVKVKCNPGLRQGAVATRFIFSFKKKGKNGEFLKDEKGEDLVFYSDASITGRVIGTLSMIISSKLKQLDSGGYVYNFGKLGDEDSKKAKAFIMLKGSERDRTKLSVGKVGPDGVIKAKLGDPTGRNETVLYPLEFEIIPGEKPLDFTGKSKGEYGTIWIESDNPKVPKMLIAVKFAVDAAR